MASQLGRDIADPETGIRVQLYLSETEEPSDFGLVEFSGRTGREGDAVRAEGFEGPRVAFLMYY